MMKLSIKEKEKKTKKEIYTTTYRNMEENEGKVLGLKSEDWDSFLAPLLNVSEP